MQPLMSWLAPFPAEVKADLVPTSEQYKDSSSWYLILLGIAGRDQILDSCLRPRDGFDSYRCLGRSFLSVNLIPDPGGGELNATVLTWGVFNPDSIWK